MPDISLRVSLLQTDIIWRDPDANFRQLSPQLKTLRDSGVQLAVLPEMFSYGFCMDSAAIAEHVSGKSTEFLRAQASQLGMHICASVPIQLPEARRPFNRFILASPDGELQHYDKIHPFTLAGEDQAYTAGQQVQTMQVAGVRVTPFICYDLRFANVFWEAAEDTDLYIVIANWPSKRRAAFSQLLRARAIENQAFVAGVNRVGQGDGLEYDGGSCLIDPMGQTIVEGIGRPTNLVADIELRELRQLRAKLPFLNDRRSQQANKSWTEA